MESHRDPVGHAHPMLLSERAVDQRAVGQRAVEGGVHPRVIAEGLDLAREHALSVLDRASVAVPDRGYSIALGCCPAGADGSKRM